MSALRVPARRFYGEVMSCMLGSIQADTARREALLDEEGWQGRRVLGFKLPAWQRPERWSDAQCERFIESVYLGANIGAYMWNDSLERGLDRILIDGQQRLRAVERYWGGEVALAGEDGRRFLWTDLEPGEQARFLRMSFPFVLTRYNDAALMREAYNRHNFGGTPHLPSEMAAEEADYRTAPTGMVPR